MASERNKDISLGDPHRVKPDAGREDKTSENRLQGGTSLPPSTSEGFKDNGDSERARMASPEPGAAPSDGSGNTPQAMAGAGKDTTSPKAPAMESGARNGRGGVKTAEPAMNFQGAGDPPNGHLDKNEKEDPDSETSSSLAAPKPSREDSWRIVMKEVIDIDDEQLKGWKEDIDTLLVFAGLFSAVVTAFTIESYQWLSDDTQDTTVALLTQIFQQMSNQTITPVKPFQATPSNVRINTFWFLSLIIALVDALFGLLCKQWLREHRRQARTRTPEEGLALHWLRRESLEIWHVPTFIAALPMLLELALFLFFAGLLELLWSRHPIPFGIATVVVGLAILVYVGTTIIPSIDIIRQALQVTPKFKHARMHPQKLSAEDLLSSLPPIEFVCPYKSPQAWVTFKAARAIFRISCVHRVVRFCLQKPPRDNTELPRRVQWVRVQWALNDTLNSLADWPLVDLELLQRSHIELVPPFYALQAFQWLVQELQDNPSMIPHLQNTLEAQPLHLVMPAVLDQWFFLPDRDWTKADIGDALQPNLSPWGIQEHKSLAQSRWLDARQNSKTFHQFLHYTHILNSWKELEEDDWNHLAEVWKKIWSELYLGAHVFLPFSFLTLDRILKGSSEHKAFGLELFKSCTEVEVSHSQHWLTNYHALPQNLAQHIIATTTPHQRTYGSPAVTSSPFVQSQTCLALVEQIHGNLPVYIKSIGPEEMYCWLEATNIIQHIHALPPDHFPPLPHYFPIPLTKLKDLLWALPDEPSDDDFGFLLSCQKHWSNVHLYEKLDLVQIISDYINKFSTTQASHSKHKADTPLATHLKGLEFLGFLYGQWEALKTELRSPDHRWLARSTLKVAEAWTKALERVRLANGLSPNEFKAMFTPLPDSHSESSLANTTLQQSEGDGTITEAHREGEDGGGTIEGTTRDRGVPAEVPSKEAIELVALAGPAEGSEDSGVSHTSQDERAVPYGEQNDQNV
ncbi:hypothetical protein V5O48_004637 [Marasmius crinis-equi]|uniref:DUF6535 domain-containing protein n=1 Tax=Marasmius crinis-equi TaxID=585013 RepID=A0ABR3FPL3_9AGAR